MTPHKILQIYCQNLTNLGPLGVKVLPIRSFQYRSELVKSTFSILHLSVCQAIRRSWQERLELLWFATMPSFFMRLLET